MATTNPPAIVAIIEDDPRVRKALGRLLFAAGFDPAMFESAEAYLDAAPEALCLVVDVKLPGMSGLDLQHRLSVRGDAPPIIVVTASHEEAIRDRAQRNGCAAFYWKPIDGSVLTGMIATLVDTDLQP